MCNVLVASSIVEVLEQMITDRKVFTAFDVTKEVRQAISDTVLHKDVRQIINNEFQTREMQDYSRELHTLNIANQISGSNPSALVYFPDGKCAADHPLVDEVSTEEDEEDDNTIVDGDDIVKITDDGRINIPKKMLNQISPTGGSYDFMINGDLHCRSRNADGRIRLTTNGTSLTTYKCRVTVDTAKNLIRIESA